MVREVNYRDGDPLTRLEEFGLQLLADGMNALAYHYGKRLTRKIGKPYRLVVEFKWTANGEMDIDNLQLARLKR